jgi:type VI protein secretion system component VasK
VITVLQTPNTSSVSFRMGEKKITVNNSIAKLSERILWPGENAHKGAEIQVTLPNGKTRKVELAGPWGALKLLEKAKRFEPNDNGFSATWRLRVEDKYDVDVNIIGEIRETENPFTMDSFYTFECAPELIQKQLNELSMSH